jgi:hypothetical protein
MAGKTLDDSVKAAVDLLPAVGTEMEFDAYKAKLYAADPDNGRDAFAHMIKKEIVNKKLSRDASGKIVVMLSRKP